MPCESKPTAIELIRPSWPAPPNVCCVISTRVGGASLEPFASANLGDHVGDDNCRVDTNRRDLARQTGINDWRWLKQVHGVNVVSASSVTPENLTADGSHTRRQEQACVVLTADCLPILCCDKAGTQIAAVHAGWRGLAAGIVDNTVEAFDAPASELMVYLGPAIGPKAFEVGADVLEAFSKRFSCEAATFFEPISDKQGHYLADLYGLARLALRRLGVTQVYGGEYCTYDEPTRFYSYRRDGLTGRMASAIWMKNG